MRVGFAALVDSIANGGSVVKGLNRANGALERAENIGAIFEE